MSSPILDRRLPSTPVGQWTANAGEAEHEQAPARSHAHPPPTEPAARIGIWRADGHGHFVRDPEANANEARMWADRPGFAARRSRTRRIVLIGESVARGFLLDPHVTPAGLLEAELGGPDAVDVIDLARTCLVEPLTLLAQAQQLEPDAIVLFGGNNLLPAHLLDLWGLSPRSRLLRQRQAVDRPAGETLSFADELGRMARRKLFDPLLEAVQAHAETTGVPVVLVAPDTNDADWNVPADWIAGADGGPVPQPLAAAPPVPWCCQSWRDAVTAAAAGSDRLRAVDLRRLFTRAGVSGRHVFYDYCHLTPPGLAIAMTAVASALRDLAPDADIHPPAPVRDPPPPATLATAAFLAAVHNAHWGQPGERVAYWLDRSIALHPPVRDLMAAYCARIASPVPPWMDGLSAALFAPSGQAGRVLFASRPPANEAALLAAIATRLGNRGETEVREAQARLAATLCQGGRLFDVLHTDHWAGFGLAGMIAPCFAQRISAPFQAHRTAALHLKLVARRSDADDGEQPVCVRVNGHELARVPVGRRWLRIEATIARHWLTEGLNRLEIDWPPLMIAPARLGQFRQAYVDGERDALRPAFGEIHATSRLALSRADTACEVAGCGPP